MKARITKLFILLSFALVGYQAPASASRNPDLPKINLTADILYQFVAADFAYFSGNFLTSYKTLADLTEKTGDPRMARKSLEYTIGTNSMALLADAAILWRKLDGYNIEALQTYYKVQALVTSTPRAGSEIGGFFKTYNPDVIDSIQRIENISFLFENDQSRQAFLQDALSPFIDHPNAKIVLLRARLNSEGSSEAISELLSMIETYPDNKLLINTILLLPANKIPESFSGTVDTYLNSVKEPDDILEVWLDYLIDNNQKNKALAIIDHVLLRFPNHYSPLFYKAKIAFDLKELAKSKSLLSSAKESLAQALADDKISPFAYQSYTDRLIFLESAILENQQQPKLAAQLLQQHDWTFNKIEAMKRIAYLLTQGEKNANASINYLNQIEALSPLEEVEIGETKVSVYREFNDNKNALATIESLIKKFPDDMNLSYGAGILAAEMKQYNTSIAHFRNVLKKNPDFAHGLNALGYTLLESGKNLDEAFSLITKAHSLSPHDAAILDSLGWIYFKRGDLENAKQYLSEAFALNQQTEIALHYAEVLWRFGQKEQAQQVLEQVKKATPENSDLKALLKRLGAS